MRWLVALLLVTALPVMAQNEPEPLPSFSECLNAEVARYERALTRHLAGPEADSFEIGDLRGVEYCGTVGIVICDRSALIFPCQHALARVQDSLTEEVRATLPAPDAVEAGDEAVLYQALYALAFDKSAGPDCGGDTEAIAAWCDAREANRRLMNAVSAWQMARFFGAAPDAVTAGWANVPAPTRPRARNKDD